MPDSVLLCALKQADIRIHLGTIGPSREEKEEREKRDEREEKKDKEKDREKEKEKEKNEEKENTEKKNTCPPIPSSYMWGSDPDFWHSTPAVFT